MYLIEAAGRSVVVSHRRHAFVTARLLAREEGGSRIVDPLGLEPDFVFERIGDGPRVRQCTCPADARLLRAIFAGDHPKACVTP